MGKCWHSNFLGLTGSQGLYFNEHKGKKLLRCLVTLYPTFISHSCYVLKRGELCFSSFAQFGSWSSSSGRKRLQAGGVCVWAQPCTPRHACVHLCLERRLGLGCQSLFSPISWVDSRNWHSKARVKEIRSNYRGLYRIEEIQSPLFFSLKLSSLDSRAWIKIVSKGLKWFKRQQWIKHRLQNLGVNTGSDTP